ncbi:MAG: PEGA domain-containing protein, partial [Acidobacteriota bacterium]|nr:PEGA domain-containing protein [Acidobacteriota bacterium]
MLKIPRFRSVMQFGRASVAGVPMGVSPASSGEGLDAFGSESALADPVSDPTGGPAVRTSGDSKQALVIARWTMVIALTAAAAVAALLGYQRLVARPVTTGVVTIDTTPAGLEVVLAGKSLGRTPLTTSLAAGAYDLRVGSAPNVKALKVNVSAGSSIVQHVEFAREPLGAAATTGGLRVQTEPARLPVLIDGTARGVSPVAIDNLEPGAHEVSVRTR